jgi:Na+/proline symporter
MFAGSATVLALFTCGVLIEGKNLFDAYQLFGVDPIVWGLLSSSVAGVVVSLLTEPPPPELVSEMFDARPATSARVPTLS